MRLSGLAIAGLVLFGCGGPETVNPTSSLAPPAFDISGFSRPGDGWWEATTAAGIDIHFHIIFDQRGSSLSASSLCSIGIQDRCITFPRNQAGSDATGPATPGFLWVLVTSAPGTLSGNQINIKLTNANGRIFTFNGTVTSQFRMTGTISGPTLPAELVDFDRPPP